jgi:hypothetical protein
MIYEFRFTLKGVNGRKARGVCEAKNLKELFWAIDRVADPYEATFRKRKGLCVCLWENDIENYSDDIGNVLKWDKFKGEGVKL